MENPNELISYRGKLVRDMTREELVEALAERERLIGRLIEDHRKDMDWVFDLLKPPRRRSFWEILRGQV